jgi:hypothetical protein
VDEELTFTFTAEELAEILTDIEIQVTVGHLGVGLVNANSMAEAIIEGLKGLNA